MNEEPEPSRARTAGAAAIDFVRERFLSIVAVLLVGAGVLIWIGVDLPPVPRYAKVYGLVFLGLSPFAYVLGGRIVEYLHEPYRTILLDLDARDDDVSIVAFPKKAWEDLEVIEGELTHCRAAVPVYIGKDLDLDEMTVKGTWKGTLDDRELLRRVEAIDECRGQLEEHAKRGFVVEARAPGLVRAATREICIEVVRVLSRSSMFRGEAIEQAVDRAIEKYTFDVNEEEPEEPDEFDPFSLLEKQVKAEGGNPPGGAAADD